MILQFFLFPHSSRTDRPSSQHNYADGMSEPKILDFLQTVGMSISAGQLSNLLIKDQELFHAERANVVQAGLSSSRLLASRQHGHPSPWQKPAVSYFVQTVV